MITDLTRRRFLSTSLGAGAAVLAACSADPSTTPATTPGPAGETTPPSPTTTSAPTTTTPAATTTTAPPVYRPSVNPYLAGNFAPVADEVTEAGLTVRGTVPAGLRGSFLRIGPNPIQVANPERHSWFPGEGMIHGVTLGDGAAAYRNRWVRTGPVSAQLGEPLVGGPAQVGFDAANTNIVPFLGEIVAITEGSTPYVVDRDLATVGRRDYGTGLTHGLSAHSKFDPATGELHSVSYRIGAAPYAVWQVVDRAGQVVRSVPIELAVPGMWHTFSITDRYVVLYDHPVVYRPDRLADGWLFPFGWVEDHPTRVGLIDRAGGDAVQWFEAPIRAINHDIAAHDTPTGVVVHVTSQERQFDVDPAGPLEAPPSLVRLTIDPAVGSVAVETVDDHAQEFPRADPRVGLGEARYVYCIGDGPGVSGGGVIEPGNAVLKHDLVRGTTEVARAGAGRGTAEAVFVPDPERSADEDGGWLLAYVYDAATDRSDLVIHDAQGLAEGPVATVELPVRVPFGFHGNWFAAD